MMFRLLVIGLLTVQMSVGHVSGPAPGLSAQPCGASPAEDLVDAVGPMVGSRPVWLVDGSATWMPGVPTKTLWVFVRTSEPVRIQGRRLDAPGLLTISRGDDVRREALTIANPARASVIPKGATPEDRRTYAFVPSHVFYPSPGCWEFTVRIGEQEFRIVRDLKADPLAQPDAVHR